MASRLKATNIITQHASVHIMISELAHSYFTFIERQEEITCFFVLAAKMCDRLKKLLKNCTASFFPLNSIN